MTRITITGATGFIGRRLVEYLRREGHDIAVLVHDQRKNPFGKNVRIFRADVTVPNTLRGRFANGDVVMHLAACNIARSKREGMEGDWMCDPARLTGELGFEFQVSLEQKIRETAECYQQKGWL